MNTSRIGLWTFKNNTLSRSLSGRLVLSRVCFKGWELVSTRWPYSCQGCLPYESAKTPLQIRTDLFYLNIFHMWLHECTHTYCTCVSAQTYVLYVYRVFKYHDIYISRYAVRCNINSGIYHRRCSDHNKLWLRMLCAEREASPPVSSQGGSAAAYTDEVCVRSVYPNPCLLISTIFKLNQQLCRSVVAQLPRCVHHNEGRVNIILLGQA